MQIHFLPDVVFGVAVAVAKTPEYPPLTVSHQTTGFNLMTQSATLVQKSNDSAFVVYMYSRVYSIFIQSQCELSLNRGSANGKPLNIT